MKNKWWNKQVTWGILIKFIISLNIIFLVFCWLFAYTGDLVDKEREDYYYHLEKVNELQSELIKAYRKILREEGILNVRNT